MDSIVFLHSLLTFSSRKVLMTTLSKSHCDMFESGGPSLVMARRFRTAKSNPYETSCASVLVFYHNKLNFILVKKIMAEAGVKGYFTNHSLRATTVSRLSREGVDDKLIRGVTGHRSETLQSYKRETDEQLVRVSKIVQGQSIENTRL